MSDLTALQDDMDGDPAPAPSGDALAQLRALGERVTTIDEQLVVLKERVAEREKARNLILTKQMPELMVQHGVSRVDVGGRPFVLEDFYHASIKKDSLTRDEAYDWLEEHDAGDIIKYTVTAEFPKDSIEQAEALARYVRERYQAATVEIAREVPWKRLTSWLKEMFQRKAGGEPELQLPPLDVFGATVGQYVKIDEPRKARR